MRGDKSSARKEEGLYRNHGVLITDELFDAYLKCTTKAHLTFGRLGAVNLRTQSATGNSTSLNPIRRLAGVVSNLPIAKTAS